MGTDRTMVVTSARHVPFVMCAAITLLLVSAPIFVGEYHLHMLVMAFFAIMLGFGHRLLLLAGQASYGHGAFYAIGAYTVAVLATTYGLETWIALAPAAVLPAIIALVIGVPVLRTRGPYFFLISFGIAVVTSSLLANLKSLTGGNSGIMGIPQLSGLSGVVDYYFLTLGLFVAIASLFLLIANSRWNSELRAVGNSSDLAAAIGISSQMNMVIAFTIGASLAGFLGGIYATYAMFVAPTAFSFWISIYILTFSMIGGATYWSGPIVGAAYVTLIPLIFNWSEHLVALFVSASIATVMLLWPAGVVGEIHRLLARSRKASSKLANREFALPAELKLHVDDTKSTHVASLGGASLQIIGLNHSYGGIQTAKNISFDVSPGQVVGIIGPNGAGKTTLFNLISGYVRPQSGQIIVDGKEIQGLAPHKIERIGLTRTFQASTVFDQLSVFENVLLGVWGRDESQTVFRRFFCSRLSHVEDVRRARSLIDMFGLTEFSDEPAASLPYGLRKLLGLAVGLATEPRVLCLDEPVAGLTDAEVERMIKTLRAVRKRIGLTMLIVEHRMPVIMELCDRVVVMNFGQVVSSGTPAQIQNDPVVHEVYFAR